MKFLEKFKGVFLVFVIGGKDVSKIVFIFWYTYRLFRELGVINRFYYLRMEVVVEVFYYYYYYVKFWGIKKVVNVFVIRSLFR